MYFDFYYGKGSRLGGVVHSVFSTRPRGRGFKPGRGDGFFNGDDNQQRTLLRMESEAGSPMS
jgi:hypothetical protein